MSNVSVCVGPPFIHSRTHERRFCSLAVESASAGIQPLAAQPARLATSPFRFCRRDGWIASRSIARMVRSLAHRVTLSPAQALLDHFMNGRDATAADDVMPVVTGLALFEIPTL